MAKPKRPCQPHHRGALPTSSSGDWLARLAGHVMVDGHGCWIYRERDEYHHMIVGTQFAAQGRIAAHRLVYGLIHDDLADELHVHHTCEQPACINPEHLIAMTPGDHKREHARLRRERAA